MKFYLIAIAAIILIIIVTAIGLSLPGQQHATKGANTNGTITRTKLYAPHFGVNANFGNAMNISLGSGIYYYRTDASLNPNTVNTINYYISKGAHFLGILDYDTIGAKASQNGCEADCNWTLSDWNASVENALAAYPNITAWEIWNEPTIKNFISGYENATPYNYYELIRSAATIIRAREPNATIVCFGGANLFPLGEYTYEWYAEVWSYGASKYCNVISLHAYSLFTYLLNQTPPTYNQTVGEQWGSLIQQYENLTNKPIWITEVGIPSTPWSAYVTLTPQIQQEFMNQSFTLFASYPYVKRIYWFNLMDSSTSPTFGILNSSGEQKPSFGTFLKFNGMNKTQNP